MAISWKERVYIKSNERILNGRLFTIFTQEELSRLAIFIGKLNSQRIEIINNLKK